MRGNSQQNPEVPSVWGLWKPYNMLKAESVLKHTGQGLMLLKLPSPCSPTIDLFYSLLEKTYGFPSQRLLRKSRRNLPPSFLYTDGQGECRSNPSYFPRLAWVMGVVSGKQFTLVATRTYGVRDLQRGIWDLLNQLDFSL